MGQKYAAFDATGKIIAYYDSVDSPLPSGVNAIPISDKQWQLSLASPGGFIIVNRTLTANLTPPPPPTPPTLSQQAQKALRLGVEVISNSTPAVSSIFPIDPTTMAKIMATAMYVQMNNKFPGNQSTFAMPDISNEAKIFPNTTMFSAFANALTDYAAALDAVILGTSTTLPSAPLTIP